MLKWHPKKAILSAIRNRHQVSTHQKMWETFFLMCSRWMLCCNEITVYRVRNVMTVNAAFHCIFCVLVFFVSYVWPFLKDQIDFWVLSVRNILHMWLFFYASRSFTCYLNILPVRVWRFPVHIWERRDLDKNFWTFFMCLLYHMTLCRNLSWLSWIFNNHPTPVHILNITDTP